MTWTASQRLRSRLCYMRPDGYGQELCTCLSQSCKHLRTALQLKDSIPNHGTIPIRRSSRPHGAIGALIVVNGTGGLRTRAASSPLKRHTVSFLGSSIHVEVVPHLGNLRAAVIQRPFACRSLIVSGSRAANVRCSAVFGAESFLEIRESVGGAVGGNDVVASKPLVGVETAVIENHGLEKVDHFFVFSVLRAIAGDVEGRKACCVLGELVLSLCQLWSAIVLRGYQEGLWLTPQRSWFGEFCAIQYVFMYSSRSYRPNGSRKVPIPEPL